MTPTSPAPLTADLESTAELPVLDPAVDLDEPGEPAALADAHHAETWVVPHPVYAATDPAAEEPRARLETSLRKAYAQARDAEALLAAREDRVRQLEDALQDARETAAQQLAQLRAVHEEFAAAAAQRRAELDAGQQGASAVAEQRVPKLGDELAQAHGMLAAATAQATQLQGALKTREAESRAHENTALERQQALLASERAHAGVLRDLDAERERNALCLESLHRAESQRQIFHSVVSDLQRELDEQQSSLTRLGHELASRDARAHEQDAELTRRAARIVRLEQRASTADAATAQPAAAQLPPPALLAAPEIEPPAVAQALAATAVVADTHAPEPAEHASQAHSEAIAARTRELEADLRAAEDTINRLESQARGRGARLEELERASREWRLSMEEARGTSADSAATNTAPRAASAAHEAQETHASARDPLPEGATRLLICKEQGREIVHVLGRKTSIGRTPDNDLQIDVKFISRHHAVILAGPVHTVVEDLNSTNGVVVNGQRVTRQMLKDGDDVVFGRAQYRFVVRRAGEKR